MSEFPIPRDGYLTFDAFTLKQHIKNALNKSGNFKDQNYEGSYMSTIIDIISYMFHVLMFYLNRTSTETMFSEAQIYENINRIVKMLDYNPLGMSTPILSFNMTATQDLPSGSYNIPRYSTISAKGIPYTFNQDISFIKQTEAEEVIESVGDNFLLYQGVWREYPLYAAKGEQNEIVYITPGKNVKIDHNNIHVYVKDTTGDGKWYEWEKTFSLYLDNGYDKKYEARLNENKQYEIKFGNNINGLKVEEGNLVAIYYLESRGSDGEVGTGALDGQQMKLFRTTRLQEIITDINEQAPIQYVTDNEINKITFFNNSISTYSTEEESPDSIRQNAPATFRSQFRLVTSEDYNTFISTNFASLIHDVKVINNWTYVSEYLKYFYDNGLTDPNNISRVLFNQVNFADACNFNNVYIFTVPKTIFTSTNNVVYLTPANKQLITSSINQSKTLTSEIVLLDPVYINFKVCCPRADGKTEVIDADNTILEITKTPSSKRDDASIKQDIINIFETEFFKKSNSKLGQVIDILQITADILNIPDVQNIRTKNTVTGDIFEGLSLIYWNPIYTSITPKIIFNNYTLELFMFPVWDDDISNKINIISEKIFETIEY
jgi:hypothetical protein